MSKENEDIVRRAYERFNQATPGDLATWLSEFYDPAIDFHDGPQFPGAAVYEGIDAFRRHADDYIEAWAETRIEVEEIQSVGEQVVARIRYDGVGRQSGTRIEGVALGAVYDFQGGRIVRQRQFIPHAEALEAAGLSE